MRGTPNIQATQRHAVHVPAANNPAVVTLTPETDEVLVVDQLNWSYDATPTGGRLTVTIGGATAFDVDITADGPGFMPSPRGLYGAANQTIVATLAAGGASCTGKLNVTYR
jgi:hypothetical protein